MSQTQTPPLFLRLVQPLKHRLPARRTVLKWLHWLVIPLTVWFIFVTPSDVVPFGAAAFQFHSILGLIYVTASLLWTADYLRRGLAGRPGPKLRGWTRTVHRIIHHALVWGLFLVAVGGFLLGLTSSVLLKAGGFLPIAPPLGMAQANQIIGKLHIYEFYALSALVIFHAGFHTWRHIRLRDNTLRIMAPKVLYRYL